MTTAEQNEAAARRCVDLFNKRTLEWVDTCYAEAAEWVELPLAGTPKGRRGKRAVLRETAERLLRLFPDRQMTVLNVVAQGEQVVMELDWQGTAAATVRNLSVGTLVHLRVASFFTFADGLIVQQTEYGVPIPINVEHIQGA